MSQLNLSSADQGKAMELIKNLQGQIECLKELYGLRIDTQNSRIPEPKEITEREHMEVTVPGDELTITRLPDLNTASSRKDLYPDSWDISWNNETLLDKLFIPTTSASTRPEDTKYSLEILSSDVHPSQRNFRYYTKAPQALEKIDSKQVVSDSYEESPEIVEKNREVAEKAPKYPTGGGVSRTSLFYSFMKSSLPKKASLPLVDTIDTEESAIHITDFDRNNKIISSDSPALSAEGFRRIFQPRFENREPMHMLISREEIRLTSLGKGNINGSNIKSPSPSVVILVLMSDIKEESNKFGGYHTSALVKHLSPDAKDRFHQNVDSAENHKHRQHSFTISYFAIYDNRPTYPNTTYDQPQRCGVFGNFLDAKSETDNKWIREEKFSVSFSAFNSAPDNQSDAKSLQEYGPWLLVSWDELCPRGDANAQTKTLDQPQLSSWVFKNIDGIIQRWDKVLNVLDQKMDVPSTVIFDPNQRFFEDENFTNSKRYFWALQSLRVFANYVEKTLEILPIISKNMDMFGADNVPDQKNNQLGHYIQRLKKLRDRIENRRQEVKNLSDGLFSASSAVEARLAADQGADIRLLTLVTIAFLPMSFITSVYGMNNLPHATLDSFFVSLVVTCFVTFFIVFNLRNTERIFRKLYRGWTNRMQQNMLKEPRKGEIKLGRTFYYMNPTAVTKSCEKWRERGMRLQQTEEFHRAEAPVSNWWYVGYFFRGLFLPAWECIPMQKVRYAGPWIGKKAGRVRDWVKTKAKRSRPSSDAHAV